MQHFNRRLSDLTLGFVFVIIAVCCAPNEETRQGAAGEQCFADLDCRSSLVCSAGICREPPEALRPDNDSDGGESVMDVPEIATQCSDFCDAITCSNQTECVEICENTFEDWSAEDFEAVTACLDGVPCDELVGVLNECLDLIEPPKPMPSATYRFVLVEDMSDLTGGDSPGTDIDAVSVTNPRRSERFATSVEDFEIGSLQTNENTNVSLALGPPDSNCEAQGYVSLGGVEQGGYIILGFSTAAEEVTLSSGTRVRVYELSPFACENQPDWLPDPYAVSVSVATNRSEFVEIGQGGFETNVFTVP